MSINNASKFITKIYERDEAVLALLPKGVSPDGIGAEEIAAIAAAANVAGWEFDADELQEAYLGSLALDEGELAAVAGGSEMCDNIIGAPKEGGCGANYYQEYCVNTWEPGDLCWVNDYDPGKPHTWVPGEGCWTLECY